MKKLVALSGLAVMLMLGSVAGVAQPRSDAKAVPAFPGILKNARYVYVTAMDGPEFSPELLREDREAISDVQNALREWGKYIVVYEPGQADMILQVQRRGSEDILAVYRPQSDIYIWRVTGQGGLDHGELGFMNELRGAVEKAAKK